jgi:hypothetical protein
MSPLLQFSEARDLHIQQAELATMAFLERNPKDFDNSDLLKLMFLKPALAHGFSDFGEMAAGFLGDGFTGDAGAELVRLEKNMAEDFEVARLVKGRQGDFMRALGRAAV